MRAVCRKLTERLGSLLGVPGDEGADGAYDSPAPSKGEVALHEILFLLVARFD